MADPGEHIVKSFEQDMKRLRALLVEMGGLVESQVALACAAVLERDAEAAARAMETDPRVDALEREVEQFVVRLLALRQPMAADLRQIIAGLKISGALERIGDYATNVAKRSLVLRGSAGPGALPGLGNIARLVQESLKTIIDAIGENDIAKAMHVWRSDEAIDAVYDALFRELVTYMMEDPRNITTCTHLLFVAKYLERVGDHATNIAEMVTYAVTGQPLTGARPKGGSRPEMPR